MKRVLSIIIGLWLLGLCVFSAIRADAVLRQQRTLDVPHALSAVPRHALAIPPAAAALLLTILR